LKKGDLGGFENLLSERTFGNRYMYVKFCEVLVRHSGKGVTQRQLLQEVRGYHSDEQAYYLPNYIHHLRHKLEADPARPVFLSTEPGVGYRLKYQE
jgi:two-component system, OmpR family, KDP operon response regulator KdpE